MSIRAGSGVGAKSSAASTRLGVYGCGIRLFGHRAQSGEHQRKVRSICKTLRQSRVRPVTHNPKKRYTKSLGNRSDTLQHRSPSCRASELWIPTCTHPKPKSRRLRALWSCGGTTPERNDFTTRSTHEIISRPYANPQPKPYGL